MAIDFKAIAARLLADAPRYLYEWLPGGKLCGKEFIAGSLRGEAGKSLSVNIIEGVWKDFATGESGRDLITLYAKIHGIKNGEAAKQFATDSDVKADNVFQPGATYQGIKPHHKWGKNPAHIFEYFQADGRRIGYVYRFEPLNEKKQFPALTPWRRPDGTISWEWKKWPVTTPLYRLPEILANPDIKILILEGEKKALHAQKMLPDWLVISWCGGSAAFKSTDWSPLQKRYCWMWPDANAVGKAAAIGIKKILPDLHIVNLPSDIPDDWEPGDAQDGFPIESFLTEELKVKLPMQRPSSQNIALLLTHMTESKDNPKPLATLENMRDLLNYYNISCKYNVISKRVEHIIPGETFSTENEEEAVLACIYSKLKEWSIPVDGHKMYLLRISDENQYNPVINWIRSAAWDGNTRLPDFYSTITSPETEAKEMLLRRWLITAVCMALYNGIDSAGCLVLQGAQDIGKTWWTKKLIPEGLREHLLRTDATVDPKDKDSVSQVISYWICELGEIGATFRKADLDAIKTFITRDHDTMRRPYGIGDKRYPRRTALIASVDQDMYLHDTAGNRRFWTIPCIAINSYHNINMQQLWAEVLHLVENDKETWRLTDEEKAHIARINKEHQQIEPIHDMIRSKYHFLPESDCWEWNTATQIAEGIGLRIITKRETNTIASFLRRAGVKMKRTGREGHLFNIAKRSSEIYALHSYPL